MFGSYALAVTLDRAGLASPPLYWLLGVAGTFLAFFLVVHG